MLRRCEEPEVAKGATTPAKQGWRERDPTIEESVEALTRTVAAVQDRRRSLMTLSAAALLAVGVTPRLTSAKGKASMKANQKCKRQVAQCDAVLSALCQPGPTLEECLDNVAECCAPLGSCNGSAAVECIVGLFTQSM